MPRFPAQIDFPERVWEPAASGGWTSYPANRDDYVRRGKVIHDLKATSNSLHIPVEQENQV
jgi:hypothetical protein